MRIVDRAKWGMVILASCLAGGFTGCSSEPVALPTASIPTDVTTASRTSSQGQHTTHHSTAEPVPLFPNGQDFQSPAVSQEEFYPEVLITTSMGDIRVKLNAEKAPRSVDNFLYNYVDTGFYEQTIIHYIEKGYMLAAGGYSADFKERPTRPPIPCEAGNGLKNRRGTIAMARHIDFANSATAQFFINLVDNPTLDYRPSEDDTINGYCVFGEVTAGMEVVDRMAAVNVHDKNGFANTPIEPLFIYSIKRVK